MSKKPSLQKIDFPRFGLPWVGAGITVGGILPLIGGCCFHAFWWPLCVIGGAALLAFAVVFAARTRRDFGRVPSSQKRLAESIPFDEATQIAVIRCSVCTGEQVAGFKNREDGSFTEVMLIRSEADREYFKKTYHLDSVKKEY